MIGMTYLMLCKPINYLCCREQAATLNLEAQLAVVHHDHHHGPSLLDL